jgi:N-acetylglutamate synthase-like GNAT family acetyltransferase
MDAMAATLDSLRVRAAEAHDVPALVRLFAQLGYQTDEAVVGEQLRVFARSSARTLVAEAQGGRIVGAATMAIHPRLHSARPAAQLTALITDSEARRSGVGRALTEAAAAHAREAGCERLYVRTNRRRAESPPFYRSLGFLETHLTFDLPLIRTEQ